MFAALATGTGLAATVYGMEASPCPPVLATDTQFALVLTDHVQSRVVTIDSVPLPPSAVKVVLDEPTCT
jgi:hypothetical protein